MIPVQNNSQRGSARLKFLVVIVILGAIAYASYLYVPVAYNAYLFKDLMQQKVNAAVALGYPASWVKDQLVKSAPDYKIPSDVEITPTVQGQRMEVRAQFTKLIEFPGYPYTYTFDHTAKSTDFIMK
jgi:hypothetical protein